MLQRMLGAALLNKHVYEEIEADSSATKDALLVVIMVSLAAGFGNFGNAQLGLIEVILLGPLMGLVRWAIWAWLTYIVGTKVLPTENTSANWGELARTTAFAQSPGMLNILGVLVGPIIFSVISFWQLACMVVAIRQALDYESTLRAVGVVVIAFIPVLLLNFALLSMMM